MARWTAFVLTSILLQFAGTSFAAEQGPYQTTGLKVGEVTDRSAVVWTRLTLRPARNSSDGPDVNIQYDDGPPRSRAVQSIQFDNGVTIGDLREATPGTDGDVRVLYRVAAEENAWQETSWKPVDGLRDFTRQFVLDDLEPATRYLLRVECRGADGQPGQTLAGEFLTAPRHDDPRRVVFAVSTGQGNDDQDCPEGFRLYPAITAIDPSFFVHTGDIVYYDKLAKTVELARYHWHRMYSWPTNVDFHNRTTSYFIKDDHDTWVNDCWPTMQTPYMHEFTFRQGQAIFLEQVPMRESTYRTVRWGRDLQIWLVEGRDFRSPNNAPDGPDKTIWGPEQKQWFKETFAASDATFRVLISPTPLVGPDRENKRDNHANQAFAHEGDELRQFLASQPRSIVICGDRHWQYMSVDPVSGLREYSCGPASDPHAGGWSQEDYRENYHRYLNVIGGFLSATIERVNKVPTLTLRFHDVDGGVKFEDTLTAE